MEAEPAPGCGEREQRGGVRLYTHLEPLAGSQLLSDTPGSFQSQLMAAAALLHPAQPAVSFSPGTAPSANWDKLGDNCKEELYSPLPLEATACSPVRVTVTHPGAGGDLHAPLAVQADGDRGVPFWHLEHQPRSSCPEPW